MKVEVLENGNVCLGEVVLKGSLIAKIEEMQFDNNCDIKKWISETEGLIGEIIDWNIASIMEDKEAINFIRYLRLVRELAEQLMSE